MALFDKKKRDRRINQDNAVEIPVYGPHDTLCAQDYRLPFMLATFEQGFEQRCKTWLKNAAPDMYNRGYMDLLIDRLEQEALAMLDNQQVDHQSAVYELSKVWVGDKIKAETKLAETQAEKAVVEREIKQLQRIYHKGTAYEILDENKNEDEEDSDNE